MTRIYLRDIVARRYTSDGRQRISGHDIIDLNARLVRRHYRRLRKAGIGPYTARDVIDTLLEVGRWSTLVNDTFEGAA